MSTLTLLLGGGLLSAAVVLYVILPLLQGREAPMYRSDEEADEDEFRRQVALSALRDVEYDYATGKMDEEDYRRLKRELSLEALRLLEEGAAAMAEPGAETAQRERAESAGREPGEPEDAGRKASADAIEAEIARIRRGLREGRACRACAQVNPRGSRFCGRCGRSLSAEAASTAGR